MMCVESNAPAGDARVQSSSRSRLHSDEDAYVFIIDNLAFGGGAFSRVQVPRLFQLRRAYLPRR